jgi:hypothetical protein
MAIRHPNETQIKSLNKMQPRDTEPLKADEMAVVEFVAADNLLNRSGSKWHISALSELTDLLPGLNLMLDHDWNEVQKNQGIVIWAWLEKTDSAPIELIEAAGNGIWNRQIVSNEGYASIHIDVAMRINSPLMDALRYCEVQFLSQGGFDYKDVWCPVCDDSYFGESCHHLLPDAWGYRDKEEQKLTMPYYERKSIVDLGEISVVTIPNLPGARVVST